MPRRHPPPLPTRWLFSDARLAFPVQNLAARLAPGSGILFRHDALAPGERWRLFRRLSRIAAARGLLLLLADTPARARRWGARGVHLRQHHARWAAQAHRAGLIVTMPVHDGTEARRARRAGAEAAFVSPIHPTRSHPGARALGTAAWLRLARQAGGKAIALGGMTPMRARALVRRSSGSAIRPGWAAIDAWEDAEANRRARQKRNCVPT